MQCHKVKYATKQFAEQDIVRIRKISKQDTVPIRAYRCHTCKMWHLTSKESLNDVIEQLKKEIAVLKNEKLELISKFERFKNVNNKEIQKDQRIQHLNNKLAREKELFKKIKTERDSYIAISLNLKKRLDEK